MDNASLADGTRAMKIEQLMDDYGTAILRMCFAYLKDMGLAEDAAQDTFIKAYRSFDRFCASEAWSEKAWLMRIAINTCKDYRRSAWFRHVDRRITAEEFLGAQQDLPQQERTLLEDIIHLAPKHREIVLLYYYQDLRVTEIMKILGISRSAVYARLDKAQTHLREKLKGGNA